MKIIKFQSENVKRIKAVEIMPEGNTVIISGANEQGKSSILDSIWLALDYKNATKDNKRPIRDGEKGASVRLDLGELIVTRSWTSNDKSYLKIENAQGATFKSPQALLDKLVGKLTFDPLAFVKMKESEQLETLKNSVELPIDLDAIEEQRQTAYSNRTATNRIIAMLEGQLVGMEAPEKDLPKKETSAGEIMDKMQEANETLKRNNEIRADLKNHMQIEHDTTLEIEQIKKELEALTKKLVNQTQTLDQTRVNVAKKQKLVDALKDPDLNAFKTQLEDIENTNEKIRNALKYEEIKTKLKVAQEESDASTKTINELKETKENAIKNAKFPVEHLSFNDEGVLYKGIPFKQECSSNQLKVSVAMAMKFNPDLRVLRITDGNLLDSGNMKVIEQMAIDNDYQIWIEKVDESGEVGVYIEDGQIAIKKE